MASLPKEKKYGKDLLRFEVTRRKPIKSRNPVYTVYMYIYQKIFANNQAIFLWRCILLPLPFGLFVRLVYSSRVYGRVCGLGAGDGGGSRPGGGDHNDFGSNFGIGGAVRQIFYGNDRPECA